MRLGFLLLALAFAGLALYLSGSEKDSSGYVISGDYRSSLLDDEVSLGSLRAVALTDEFRGVVEGRVEVTDVPESPFHVRVSTITTGEGELHAAHKRAVHLLSTELKELALTEVNSMLDYLEKVGQKSEELAGQSRVNSKNAGALVARRLSETDSARALLLKDKIAQLESFLSGGELPKSLRLQLDRESLRNAEARVEKSERELARLAKVFQPASKAVQAQRELVERARADLLELERELAEVYLRSLKIELENLDDKAASIVERNSTAMQGGQETTESGESAVEGTEWLASRAVELRKRVEEISAASALKLDGQLIVTQRTGSSRPYLIGCWVASLIFFLAALFSPSIRDREESPQFEPVRQPRSEPSTSVVRLEFSDAMSGINFRPTPDRIEVFFEDISREMAQSIGRAPRRILVLGDSPVESRLAFSIRLANSLGKGRSRVRLIDFDFQSKSLSQRLGRESLPGVGDLLNSGGPVDEFFSSIAGTRIQFAPAGSVAVIGDDVGSDRVEAILGGVGDEVTIIDASSA